MRPELFIFDMASLDVAEGMLCGGTAEVLLDYLEASSPNKKLAEDWLGAVTEGRTVFY
jgi:hypothetical protein